MANSVFNLSAPTTSLRESYRECLLRGLYNARGEQIESVVLHLRKHPLAKAEFDPEARTAGVRYPDRFSGPMIGEVPGSVGRAAKATKRHRGVIAGRRNNFRLQATTGRKVVRSVMPDGLAVNKCVEWKEREFRRPRAENRNLVRTRQGPAGRTTLRVTLPHLRTRQCSVGWQLLRQ